MGRVSSGLERLLTEESCQKKIDGNIALLCHNASITADYRFAVSELKKIFGERLVKLMGPQHGILGDVQDNMIESPHFEHPYFKLPVYSLYSETRAPSAEMLKGVDTIIIDLQDVGTRVYTYISTLLLTMQVAHELGINVVVLDRPNPIGGEIVEGQILDDHWSSFVGMYPIPQRHGLTMGEMAKLATALKLTKGSAEVIAMKNWKRSMFYHQTGLPWVPPSPNLPTMEGAYCFPGTVLYEGTGISEGRGTTRSLEVIGHPKLEPYSFVDKLQPILKEFSLTGFTLRPIHFRPTFQKHAGVTCGGIHIHPKDIQAFRPWRLGQVLLRELYKELGDNFSWSNPPYEYEHDKNPIDLINGGKSLRLWVEENGSFDDLLALENKNLSAYTNLKENIKLYN